MVSSSIALAQENGGGIRMTFGVDGFARFDEKSAGDDTTSIGTRLRFGLESETRSQALRLDLSSALEWSDGDFDTDRPAGSLSYTRSSRSSSLDAEISYREVDVDGWTPEGDFESADLIEDDGVRADLRANLDFETGREAPFGTSTQLSYRKRDYTDTSDPDLYDSETRSVSTALRFDVDRRISLRLAAARTETDDDDLLQTRRKATRLGFGGDLQITPVLALSADVRAAEIETTRDFGQGNLTTSDEATEFSLGLIREMKNGDLALSLSSDLGASGTVDTIEVRRSLELSNGDDLRLSLGMTRFEGGETRPLAGLDYRRETSRGALQLGLSQTAAVNDDDEDEIRTFLSASYSEEINANSSWALRGSVASLNVVDGATSDRMRADVTLSYNYALTEDWDLSTSLQHRLTKEDGASDTRTNVLSLNIARDFAFRP